MPKLSSFTVRIRTGARGLSGPPRFQINGFTMPLSEVEGSAGPGGTLVGVGRVSSYPHRLLLCGPEAGAWDIASFEVTYACEGEPPYAVRFGAVTLDAESDLDLWQERPAPTFDV